MSVADQLGALFGAQLHSPPAGLSNDPLRPPRPAAVDTAREAPSAGVKTLKEFHDAGESGSLPELPLTGGLRTQQCGEVAVWDAHWPAADSCNTSARTQTPHITGLAAH